MRLRVRQQRPVEEVAVAVVVEPVLARLEARDHRVPGLGLIGLGRSKKDARVAADIAETVVKTVTDAEALGLDGLVMHPGAFTTGTEAGGLQLIADGLRALLRPRRRGVVPS